MIDIDRPDRNGRIYDRSVLNALMAQIALSGPGRQLVEEAARSMPERVVFMTASPRNSGRCYAHTMHGMHRHWEIQPYGRYHWPKLDYTSPSNLDTFYERGSLQNNLKSVNAKKALAADFISESRKRADRNKLRQKVMEVLVRMKTCGWTRFNNENVPPVVPLDVTREGLRMGVFEGKSVGEMRVTKKGRNLVNKLTKERESHATS